MTDQAVGEPSPARRKTPPPDTNPALEAVLELERGPKRKNSDAVERLSRIRCSATSRTTGERCKRPAIPGGTVCRYHGGAAPATRRRAALRLAELIDPALAVLAREMTSTTNKSSDRLRAVENVLDRAGLPRRTEGDDELSRELLLQRLVELRATIIEGETAPDTGPGEETQT